MTTDLKTLSYGELVDLDGQVKVALESRSEELADAKKDWLKCEKGGGQYLARIEELRKKHSKLADRCNKAKAVTLRVQMNVEVSPGSFDTLLQSRWEQGVGDVFTTDCSGKLLNPEVCGNLASDIQEQIDNVMSDLCGEVLGIHGDLDKDLEAFVDEWNTFIEEFQESGGNKYSVNPGDVVKANAKKKAAKAKVKGKK